MLSSCGEEAQESIIHIYKLSKLCSADAPKLVRGIYLHHKCLFPFLKCLKSGTETNSAI